jgi:integrase
LWSTTEAGPRLSEIRALKVGNVDFNAGVLRFEDGFTTTGGHAGNKGRRVRSVPMTRNVRKALTPFCEGKSAEMLVFEHDAKPGEPICSSGLYRRFLNAGKRADLPVPRLHDLRHTFGTQAIRGFKIHEVQRLMGHRHITTTERTSTTRPTPMLQTGSRRSGRPRWRRPLCRGPPRPPTWCRCTAQPEASTSGSDEGRAVWLAPARARSGRVLGEFAVLGVLHT